MRWAGWVTMTRAVAWSRRLPPPVRIGAAVVALAATASGVLAPAAPLVEPPGVVLVEPVAPADGGSDLPLAVPPVVPPVQAPVVGETSSAAALPAALEIAYDSLGIPRVVLGAYHRAADAVAREDPGCHLGWALLAGIGKVESGHARGGAVDATGLTRSPILGPMLDGHPGTAAIHDTDGGRWDESTVWDRAVGPMQFIPSSWVRHGVDGNADGVADPSNVYDATLSAGDYLCAGGQDLATPAGLHAAVLSYNHSEAYVATVLAWMRAYASGAVATTAVGVAAYGPVVVAPAVAAATTPTPQPSPSPSASPTPTPTVSATPTASPSPSGSPTPTESPTPTDSPTPTGCPTPSPTTSADPSPTADVTPPPAEATPSPSPSPTGSPDPSASPDPSTSPDPGAAPAAGCPSPTPTPTGSASPTPTG